jgi:hypothetical protein
MNFNRRLLVAAFGLAAITAAGTASAETRWEHAHPRQAQVLERDARLRHEIRAERREGEISRTKAHRLLVADRRIAHEDHRLAQGHDGGITKAEQHRLNGQETRLARHVPS